MEKLNTLLIVDDDASSLMELASILKQDYKIYAVKDGRPALDKAQEAVPDLILLDVVMPGMSGFEVLAELKKMEKTKHIPVLFITGVNDNEGEREGFACGAVDYIRKPFDAMVVKHRVRLQAQIVNLQRDLENAANVAMAASQSKSSFVANMSHEIRTPMNSIMGITDILLHNENRTTEDITDGLGRIYASGEMLLDIINDILDFSKMEAGKLDVMSAMYKVSEMISDTIQQNIIRIENKPIEFKLDIDEQLPAKLVGDELRIKQVLNNVLSNAFKYTDAGTVKLSISFKPDTEQDGITLVMLVEDTGHGMTKEQLNNLFDEYSRFNENARNRPIEGTGLGLSIMRLLLELMNGSVHVESEPEKGTSATIRIPQGVVDANIIGKKTADDLRQLKQITVKKAHSASFKREPMPYGSVLVVDDTDANLFVAVRLMEPYKLRIDTASNGREAVELIQDGKVYDVIFMDHMMPEMDGMEATKHLRDTGYTHPIVALTANAISGQAEMFLENGFDEFISKPINIRVLDSILLKHIKDKQPQDVIDSANSTASEESGSPVSIGISLDATDEEIDPMLYDAFRQDARRAVATLTELKKKDEWYKIDSDMQKYIITVHGLKSILNCINEPVLSQIAASLETAGRDKNIEEIELKSPDFLEEIKVLLEKVEVRIKEAYSGDEDDDDIEKLRESLHKVSENCVEYNRKGALGIIHEFKNMSKRTSDMFERIKELILQSDFEDAGQLALEYAQELLPLVSESSGNETGAEPADGIQGLDMQRGIERFDGNEKTYYKTLRSYAASTLSALNEIGSVDEDTVSDYKIKVHGIKGSSYDAQANEVGRLAEELENAANNFDLDFIHKHHPAFQELARKLVSDIGSMLTAFDNANPRPLKDKPDESVLVKLIMACENYSMDDVDAAMTELEHYTYEVNNELVEKLRKHVDIMQFSKIVNMLKDELN